MQPKVTIYDSDKSKYAEKCNTKIIYIEIYNVTLLNTEIQNIIYKKYYIKIFRQR